MARGSRRRRWGRIALAAALLYLMSYVVLSALGAYRPDISGRMRWAGGMGLTDCEFWQPLGMYHKGYLSVGGTRRTSADPAGWLYAPLISVDRAWVHKTHFYFE
jgi:hypothetical protein